MKPSSLCKGGVFLTMVCLLRLTVVLQFELDSLASVHAEAVTGLVCGILTSQDCFIANMWCFVCVCVFLGCAWWELNCHQLVSRGMCGCIVNNWSHCCCFYCMCVCSHLIVVRMCKMPFSSSSLFSRCCSFSIFKYNCLCLIPSTEADGSTQYGGPS